jgi:hypothetical protein
MDILTILLAILGIALIVGGVMRIIGGAIVAGVIMLILGLVITPSGFIAAGYLAPLPLP